MAPRSVAATLSPRGRDSRWASAALVVLLAGTAVAYLWGLGASGWANAYYSAAVQAGAHSWKAFFFGSTDAANFITVDKAPAFLWPMEISARLFGVNAWSILVPQALEGVAAVALLWATVRRWFGAPAGLLAGLCLALTPVAALMFRFNNPDALLALLLTGSVYALVRGVEDGRTRWIVLAGALVGLGFLAKMLQALLVVPALGAAYLGAGQVALRRRIVQLLAGGAAMVAAAGWWVLAVVLTPAPSRPYIGGSSNNSLLNLILGYNGFGRLTGSETGSVGGGAPSGPGRWGPTGVTRLFNAEFGAQGSWLLPAALVLVVALAVCSVSAAGTRRLRAATVLFGGWLLVTAAAISFGKGIIHPYYTVALAPPAGALIGAGATELWHRRGALASRAALTVAVGLTCWWSETLLARTPGWHPTLRLFVLAGGVAASGLLLVRGRWRHAAVATGALALITTLAGPAAYTWATVTTPHAGAIPSAGPAGQPIGPGGGFPTFAGGGGRPPFRGVRPPVAGAPPFASRSPGTPPFGSPPFAALSPPFGAGSGRHNGPGAIGGLGGILDRSHPPAELTAALRASHRRYTWVAAVVSANQAAGYQLASGDPVMAIGGFNGTDPAPGLSRFERLVAAGRIHYFIGGEPGLAGGPGPGGPPASAAANAITTWVESHFTPTTIGGVAVYDLTAPATAAVS